MFLFHLAKRNPLEQPKMMVLPTTKDSLLILLCHCLYSLEKKIGKKTIKSEKCNGIHEFPPFLRNIQRKIIRYSTIFTIKTKQTE